MDDRFVAPLVGGVLLLMGGVMMRLHVVSWRRQKQDPTLDQADRRHYHARYRRRMQMSGLLFALGILIPLGDAVIPWLIPRENAPALFAIYWTAVLLMLVWLIAVAVGDILATGAHSRASLTRIHRKQRELEDQLSRMRSRESDDQKHSG